ncbi:hypothetical protein RND81_02G101800 [Saponaria officinalis]|uniref:Late embryogenesis abundant protein n=1 Tax=Saponaria officinalis TaxID=3572 RepID=A0AAW1MKQ1_SAPOF
MQAIKEKIGEMSSMRKAKSEARAEEKEEIEKAEARKNIAKEVRKAKEAEAAMDMHVAKAGEVANNEIAKHASHSRQHHSS